VGPALFETGDAPKTNYFADGGPDPHAASELVTRDALGHEQFLSIDRWGGNHSLEMPAHFHSAKVGEAFRTYFKVQLSTQRAESDDWTLD